MYGCGGVAIVCPSCDAEPALDATIGSACPSCGTLLVGVSDPESLIGVVIDNRFEIVAKLGQGGMGTVYRAKQRSIGREIALKLIDRRFESDVASVKRFLREAKLASALSHPNTVGVIDFGQSGDGRLYLAMELVRGETLYDVVTREKRLPVARIARIATQLCDALEAAHAQGIVHRDLKLENVMRLDGPADRDLVKILDFGLARSLVDVSSRATKTGTIAGTPRYLPPEVVFHAADPAPAQDMYAVGVMIGELATGKPLWDAPTIDSLFVAKADGPPPLDAVPPSLRPLLEKLLAFEPADRPSAAQLRTQLAQLDLSAPTPAPPPASKPAPGSPLAAALGSVPTEHLTGVALAQAIDRAAAPQPPPAPLDISLAPLGSPLRPSATPPSLAAPSPPAPVSTPPTAKVVPTVEFEAPSEAGPALELETAWVAKKKHQQDVAAAPPPRRPLPIGGIFAAIVVIGLIAAVVGVLATRQASPPRPSPQDVGHVGIEIRARMAYVLKVDGNTVGRAPQTVHVPKLAKPVTIEAQIGDHTVTKTVISDRDQLVEFP